MAGIPENNERRSWVGPVVLAAGIASAAAWFGAEPIAKHLIGEPPPPPELPQKPTRVIATRGPIEIAVGFDTSRSEIMNDLPTVTAETRRFFDQTGILQSGDRVAVCTFVEDAQCKTFDMPQDRAALSSHIGSIRPEAPRSMATYVHRSISQTVARMRGEGIVLAWTDGEDLEKGAKQPLPPGHPPVTIVVPKDKYRLPAQSVDRALGDTGIEVEVARNSAEFGRTLENFSRGLTDRAQTQAQAEADREYAARTAEYNRTLAAHDDIVAQIEAARTAVEERIHAVKRTIKIIAASIAGLIALIAGWDYRERNKPRTRGFIVDRRTKFPTTYRLPVSTEEKVFTALGQRFVFRPTRQGLNCNGRLIRHGDQIMDGVFYYERDPDTLS